MSKTAIDEGFFVPEYSGSPAGEAIKERKKAQPARR
jgi:hypothetical protein